MSPASSPDVTRTGLPLRLQERPLGSLRVAVDLSLLRPGGENGGIKPFIFEYLRGLARLEGTRITFVFLTWSCSHADVRALARPHDELICVRHLEASPIRDLGTWRDGELLWLQPPPDLLIQLDVALLYAPLSTVEFACPGIPTIATVADVLHRDFPFSLEPPIVALRETLFQEMVRVADRFQCISSSTAERLQALYGVEAARVFRTYIVIQARLPDLASSVHAAHPRKYFFFPANAWKHKNHGTLLVAYRLYWHAAGDAGWDLVLTGHDDSAMREVVATAEALGLRGRVHFRGHLPAAELASVWSNAGALVFPSLHEGFGIPLLEAMHFGVPVLAHQETSLPEIAGAAAHFADARDPVAFATAMARIASDGELRARLVAAGRRRLTDFRFEDEMREFLATLRSTAEQGTRRHWAKGVHPDGWTERRVAVALPNVEIDEVEIEIAPMPAARRLRVHCRQIPFGGFELQAGVPHRIRIAMAATGGCLRLEIPDACNLNPEDHRQHGVLLRSIAARSRSGESHSLYPSES